MAKFFAFLIHTSNFILLNSFCLYPERESNPHGPYGPSDFKSDASAIPPSGHLLRVERGTVAQQLLNPHTYRKETSALPIMMYQKRASILQITDVP